MTIEEVVNELKDRVKSAEYVDSDYIDGVSVDALKMAISALSGPDTNIGDTISRQAVIDAIEEVDWYHQNKNKDMVHGANSSEHQAWYKAEDIYKALAKLPCVQPEIIKCEDCRYYDVYECKHPRGLVFSEEDDFCSHAKRRIK